MFPKPSTRYSVPCRSSQAQISQAQFLLGKSRLWAGRVGSTLRNPKNPKPGSLNTGTLKPSATPGFQMQPSGT